VNEFNIIILPKAEEDIDQIMFWYADEFNKLSLSFAEDLDKTFKKLKRNARFCFNIENGIRRASLIKFPYYIIFTIEDNNVIVHTIIHQHRDPEEWQKRIGL
jgi:plasmid stabilization system protein ParE